MDLIFTLSLILIVPIILKASEETKFVNKISPIALAYAAGIALSFISIPINEVVLVEVTEISIALSICLLVLASNMDKFRVLLKPVLKSFLLGILSLFIAILLTYFIIGGSAENSAKIMGMLTGVYVGGTPNLNAIGMALEVPNETLSLVNTAEIVYGGIYFLLLLAVIKPFLSIFLKNYTQGRIQIEQEEEIAVKKGFSDNVKMIGIGLLVSIAIIGVSYGLVLLISGKLHLALFLFMITTLGVLSAQLSAVKRIRLKFETADFLLLIFSFGIGLQIDLETLLSNGMEIYMLVGSVFTGTILIHYFLAWVIGTDADTLIISSTAALYGPAFIAPIAKSINNRELIIYGIALGLLGYILGNYLGLGIAWLLEMFGG